MIYTDCVKVHNVQLLDKVKCFETSSPSKQLYCFRPRLGSNLVKFTEQLLSLAKSCFQASYGNSGSKSLTRKSAQQVLIIWQSDSSLQPLEQCL